MQTPVYISISSNITVLLKLFDQYQDLLVSKNKIGRNNKEEWKVNYGTGNNFSIFDNPSRFSSISTTSKISINRGCCQMGDDLFRKNPHSISDATSPKKDYRPLNNVRSIFSFISSTRISRLPSNNRWP